MATKNLELTTINGSDYVSPTPLNNNFNKIDKLGVDFIESRGTSGQWTYRKWKSGIVDLWGKFTYSKTSAGLKGHALPFPFTLSGTPVAVVSGGESSNTDVLIKHVDCNNTQVTAYIEVKGLGSYWIFVHVEGKYK